MNNLFTILLFALIVNSAVYADETIRETPFGLEIGGEKIRSNSLNQYETKEGTYKKDSLGNWSNGKETFKRDNMGDWKSKKRKIRSTPLGWEIENKD